MMDSTTGSSVRVSGDNGVVIDFLTTCASVLLTYQKISQKDVDRLRLVLSEFAASDSRHNPLLLHLVAQENDFVAMLICHFGYERIIEIFFANSLRPKIQALTCEVLAFADALLQKAPLFLNRHLKIYSKNRYLNDQPASLFMINMCEKLGDQIQVLLNVESKAMVLPSFDMANLLDQKVAEDLGMKTAPQDPLGPGSMSLVSKELALNLDELVARAKYLYEQFTLNGLCLPSLKEQVEMQLTCEQLAILKCTDLFAHFRIHREPYGPFSIFQAFVSFELQRLTYLNALEVLTSRLKNWATGFIGSIRAIPTPDREAFFSLSDQLRDEILFSLLSRGIKSTDATNALYHLNKYFEDHKVLPENILPGEISRIHPSLSPEILDCIKSSTCYSSFKSTSTQALPTQSHSQEKIEALKKSRHLEAFFKSTLKSLTPILLLALLILSQGLMLACGLKANPQSDIPPLRPEIPSKPKLDSMPTKASKVESTKTKTEVKPLCQNPSDTSKNPEDKRKS